MGLLDAVKRIFGQSQDEQAYHTALAEGRNENFSDFDKLGFLKVCCHDKRGRPVVCVGAMLFPAKQVDKDRVYRYMVAKLHDVVQEPYVLAWLHTRSTYWQNCPSAWWMWTTYESLPPSYRDNLTMVHVVHCDLSLWGATLAALPWWSAGLWNKINWISRVEFLWDHVDKRQMLEHVPDYVMEHDRDLEEQPLQDYGIVATADIAGAIPGHPGPP